MSDPSRAKSPTGARRPVRAAIALAGGGSLGTFLAGATRELLIAIRGHNTAAAEGAPDDDPRYVHPNWGHVTVDALGGSSAGALCAAQVLKALFEPSYTGEGLSITEPSTMTGDWIHGGDFTQLAVEGNTPSKAGPVEAPGWTLLSGANLFNLASTALRPHEPIPRDEASPLDPTGVVAIGVTLTDLIGYHEPAEFAVDRVAGHPSFGAVTPSHARVQRNAGLVVRDLGGRGHAEVRKLFVASDFRSTEAARRFLSATRRRGRARATHWCEGAAERLATLSAASAALPLAVGPVAVTDRAADTESEYRRLYMDGGILNNKPVAPALKLARWHDGVRLAARADQETGEIPIDAIDDELVYERVCFFVDAFPDRCVGDWRSPHPDEAFRDTGVYQLTRDAVTTRNERIDDALRRPNSALKVLFESMLNSLRAQDILGIAKTNQALVERNAYIDERCARVSDRPTDFRLDTIEKAQAFASVRNRPMGRQLERTQALKVAQRIWESDRFSGLGGRRPVTMIPVFAPDNLRSVFAGEALYAVGGLLAYDARKHDAGVGTLVARQVIDALRRPGASSVPVALGAAPSYAQPDDTSPLVARLRVASAATVDGLSGRPSALRFLAKLPLRLRPIVEMLTAYLDGKVAGRDEE